MHPTPQNKVAKSYIPKPLETFRARRAGGEKGLANGSRATIKAAEASQSTEPEEVP